MIHIDFYLDGFKISGHAKYATKGKDIVCAAISGICFGSINWFNKKDIIIFESNEEKAELTLKVNLTEKNKMGISLIETQIKTISDSYYQFCKFKKHNKELE
ncbi:MAG: ribosomal-processing cysteine protease Prp [Malacoplasma sp.]|nr:ribosomal-processing cysteine protease Prp [Malacoplasma sp.]MDE6894167.1 ribosomal-processing cysteine protease Prp [Malacoplasma sp.]